MGLLRGTLRPGTDLSRIVGASPAPRSSRERGPSSHTNPSFPLVSPVRTRARQRILVALPAWRRRYLFALLRVDFGPLELARDADSGRLAPHFVVRNLVGVHSRPPAGGTLAPRERARF